MKEDRLSTGPGQLAWWDRVGLALTGVPRDRDQLMEVLRDAQSRRLINPDALEMIEGVFEVTEMQARDIMVPRSQMVVVERDWELAEMLPVVVKSAHSRFPVVGDSRDQVIGILLAKDLLRYCVGHSDDQFNLREILRPAVFIPESKRLNVLLKEFRDSRNHIAIVVDEYGGVGGLVTIEDVLEQIVGEIDDEHDIDDDAFIVRHSDSRYVIKALTPIEDFNNFFGTEYSDEDYDTVGGLIINRLGTVPKRGEMVSIDRFRFKVTRADHRRLHLLQMSLREDNPPPLRSQA
jgi:magnesium and cobalt transporter